MGTNLHKDLTDAQLHVPKGFSTASNSTILTKDSGGSLVWATDGSTGISNKRLSFNMFGAVSAKSSANYSRFYAKTMQYFEWSSGGGTEWTGTITPEMVMKSCLYVIPADCTVEKTVFRAFSQSATMNCSLKLYAYRYDCLTTPTTITEYSIETMFDAVTVPTGEIGCVSKNSFTTSTLLSGDMIVMTMMVDGATSSDFVAQGNMLLKLT